MQFLTHQHTEDIVAPEDIYSHFYQKISKVNGHFGGY